MVRLLPTKDTSGLKLSICRGILTHTLFAWTYALSLLKDLVFRDPCPLAVDLQEATDPHAVLYLSGVGWVPGFHS